MKVNNFLVVSNVSESGPYVRWVFLLEALRVCAVLFSKFFWILWSRKDYFRTLNVNQFPGYSTVPESGPSSKTRPIMSTEWPVLFCFQNSIEYTSESLIQEMFFRVVKVNNFQGDFTVTESRPSFKNCPMSCTIERRVRGVCCYAWVITNPIQPLEHSKLKCSSGWIGLVRKWNIYEGVRHRRWQRAGFLSCALTFMATCTPRL